MASPECVRHEKNAASFPLVRHAGDCYTADMKSEWEKMISGDLYAPLDEEIAAARARARVFMKQYNESLHTEPERREALLQEYLGGVGERPYIETPFRCDYGCNIRVGDDFYANFDCLFLDSAPITIGNNVMLGPGVHIYTPCHPLQKDDRNSGQEYSQAVRIGNDVWIGGRAIICPGVSIGNACVIGAGAVVTRDVPDNTVVAGNPARPIRTIDQDKRQLPAG